MAWPARLQQAGALSLNPAKHTTLSCVGGTAYVSEVTVTVAGQSPVDGSVDVPDKLFGSTVPPLAGSTLY